jgi:hypothetical protein
MFRNDSPLLASAGRSAWSAAISRQRSTPAMFGAILLLAAAAPASAQSYDPDLGAGNTAPPGITYGGGLPERSTYRYGTPGWSRSVLSHRAEVLRHRPKHARHRPAR